MDNEKHPAALGASADTLAFLFTDIEASTRRWEADPVAMAADLARHDKLLTDIVTAAGGSVFNHTGDGLCAAFPTVAAALSAAVTGQIALAAETWAHSSALRVRMGVNVGAVERRGGNYFGPTLNLAARVMGSAWGGQVLCSAAVVDLAAGRYLEQVSLRELGEARLAGLERPERIFQVLHPRLGAEFPPLRVALEPRHNLPVAMTSFVGRVAEVRDLVDHLERSRLITLLGPGGAGKTRLSLETAAAVIHRFPDGAWFAELAPVRDPALVAPEVATALGLDAGALSNAAPVFVDALCESLRNRRLLLVLDNCEHVIAAAADLAYALVARCPGITVLASSREVLGVAGEAILPIGPLGLPDDDLAELDAESDAVALFCARARDAGSPLTLTAATVTTVARICRRLDGSPLALELAAARVRVLGVKAIADRLDDRFALLVGGPRNADARHQSLQATVDWSYHLLSEDERAVLRRLSVFPADFDLAAAEAVCAGGEDLAGPPRTRVFDLVCALADKSLLVARPAADAGVRYRQLETVRQYAESKLLAAGEVASVRDRHCDFFGRFSADWYDEAICAPGFLRIQRASDDLRSAAQWAWERGDHASMLRVVVPQWLYWMNDAPADANGWLQRAVDVPTTADVGLHVQARCGLAVLLLNAGGQHASRAFALIEDALALGQEQRDGSAAYAGILLSQLRAGSGDVDGAEALARTALREVEESGWLHVEAYLRALIAELSVARGDLRRAHAELEEVLALPGAAEGSYALPHALSTLALLDAVAGDDAQARSRAARSTELLRRFPRQAVVMSLVRAAEAAVIGGHHVETLPVLAELLTVQRELGSHRWVAESLELTAMVLGPEQPEAVATLLGSAVALRGSLREEGGFLAVLGELVATCSAAAKAACGAAASAHAARGAAMSLDEVLAYARAQLQESRG